MQRIEYIFISPEIVRKEKKSLKRKLSNYVSMSKYPVSSIQYQNVFNHERSTPLSHIWKVKNSKFNIKYF